MFLILIQASLFLFAYLWIVMERINYPFDLEWMEGGSALHVQRILDKKPLYAKPSVDFTPYIYTPLYYYLSSMVSRMIGNGYASLRIISFFSSIGCFILIFLISYRKTKSYYFSFLAPCMFAATYPLSGSWFDLARVDMLFLFLLLGSIYTYESKNPVLRSFASPLLMFLSFFAKQTAMIGAVVFSINSLILRKRYERIFFPLIFFGLLIFSTIAMNIISDGWYSYYVFKLPRYHGIVKSMIFKGFWIENIIRYLGIAFYFCMVSFLKRKTNEHEPERYFNDVSIFGGLALTSWFAMMHAGSYMNAFMPIYTVIAIYFCIGVWMAIKRFGGIITIRLFLFMAIFFQFLNLSYEKERYVPKMEDREYGEKIINVISRIRGEVYCPDHPWYLAMAGKEPQAPTMAVIDVLRSAEFRSARKDLEEEIKRAIENGKYTALLMDFPQPILPVSRFEKKYKLINNNLVLHYFEPVTGWKRKPRYLYERRSSD